MIKIGANFALGANSLNVILYEKHIGKRGKSEGKEVWRESAYFANPHNALNHLVDHHIRKTELKDIKAVCEKIDELYALIKMLELPRETLRKTL